MFASGKNPVDGANGADGTTYVDRGDPSVSDFTMGNFTADNNWHVLDLSAIIPENTVAVHFVLVMLNSVVNKLVQLRKYGNSNDINISIVRSQVAGQRPMLGGIVCCSSDRKIEYLFSSGGWGQIDFAVRGWFIP